MIRADWQDMGALPVYEQPKQQEQPKQEQKPKRSGWKSFVPMGAGLLASLAAAPFTGGASLGATAAILGGAGLIGGGAGEWAAQKLNKEKTDVGAIAKEGLINGALSAIPLGKLTSLGRSGAKTVAKEAGESAVAGGARNWVSKKLLSTADDTALRATQLSGKKEALKNFEKRYGEDLGKYIRNKDLIGKTGKEVEDTVISGLNKKYGDIVSKIGRPISTSDILVHNQKSLEKLVKSASTENKSLAVDISNELKQIFKDGAIDPKRLNEIKSEYQALAKNAYKLGSNTKASVNEKVAEYLKKTLQGVSGSNELKVVGKEIDKAYKAADLLSTAAQNGRGTLSIGLSDAAIAAPGAVVGGLPGMAAAVGAKKVFNSPTVQKFITNKLASTGEKIAASSAKRAATDVVVDTSAKGLIKQAGKAQLPGRTLQALMQGGGEPAPAEIPQTPQSVGAFDSTGAQQDQIALMQMLNGGSANSGAGSEYTREAMISDIKRDPTNTKEYMALYESLNPVAEQATPLTLSDAAITKTTDAQKALDGLSELDTILADGYAGGKISGNVRKLNPFDNTFKTQQASIDRIRQIVGKALEGGVLRKEDEDKYKKILPTMQDEAPVYRAKVAQLREMISADMQQYLAMQQQYGKGAGQVASTDLMSIMGAQ